MPVSTPLKELLDSYGIAYERRTHPTAYTAVETAKVAHIPAGEMVKTVIVKADGLLRMAVLPADKKLDLRHLQFITRAESIRLATEDEFRNVFPNCEVGAMAPFGNDYGIPVFCDTLLQKNEYIEFNAGTHDETIRMKFSDFKRLARPTMVDLADHRWQEAA